MGKLIERLIEGAIVIGIVYICLTSGGCMTIRGFGEDLQAISAPYCEGQ
jgi:predicted small secreted protein